MLKRVFPLPLLLSTPCVATLLPGKGRLTELWFCTARAHC